jgi:hypothetical protein
LSLSYSRRATVSASFCAFQIPRGRACLREKARAYKGKG